MCLVKSDFHWNLAPACQRAASSAVHRLCVLQASSSFCNTDLISISQAQLKLTLWKLCRWLNFMSVGGWGWGVCHGDFGNPKGPPWSSSSSNPYCRAPNQQAKTHPRHTGMHTARTHTAVRQFLPYHASSDSSRWEPIEIPWATKEEEPKQLVRKTLQHYRGHLVMQEADRLLYRGIQPRALCTLGNHTPVITASAPDSVIYTYTWFLSKLKHKNLKFPCT